MDWGADNVIEYSASDIEPSFIEKNKSIMSKKRGFGLWLWKPYFIQGMFYKLTC